MQVFAIQLNTINLKNFKEEDNLIGLVNIFLEKEQNYFANDSLEKAENTLDSILLNVWREPQNPSENDLFFRVNWYKAFYQKDKGNILLAKKYFEYALKYYSNSSKKYQSDLLIIYPPLGNIYTIFGDNDKAILIHEAMINEVKKTENYQDKNNDLAVAYTNLSIVFETKNNFTKAISILSKVFDLKDVSTKNLAIAYSNYGNFFFQINELEKAENELEKAKQLFQKSKNFDTYYLGGIYRTLALINIENKAYKNAHKNLDLSIVNYLNSKNNRNRELAKTYLEKAKISTQKELFLDKSLQYLLPNKSNNLKKYFPNENELFAENTLVDVFYEQMKLSFGKEKLQYFDLIFEVQKLLRKEYLFKNSKQELLKVDNRIIKEAIDYCSKEYSKTKESFFAEKALVYIENEKAILLYETLKLDNKKQENYIVFNNTKKALINDLIEAKLNKNHTEIAEKQKELKQLEFDYEIKNKSQKDSTIQLRTFDIEKFKKELKENETLLVFYFGKSIYSIAISKENSSIVYVAQKEDLIKDITIFSSFFSFKNRFYFDKQIANKIGKLLTKNLPKNTNKIFLVTDDFFNNIPFEALMIDNAYFIEKYNIQYVFSANILQNVHYKKDNNKQVLAIAPIFKKNKNKQLLKSEKEVKNILKQIKGEQLLESNANTTNFLSKAKDFAIVHISSHAQIDEKLNTASIDFFDKSLYFSQIENEYFESELLVLSACETGIGKNEIGEGNKSLAKAFAYSKIPSIISSLWKVNEESSAIIFKSFYKNLASKTTISESLRNAKLDYLKNLDISEENKTPYYWASFILVGNDAVLDLDLNQNSLIRKVFLIFLIIILIVWYILKQRRKT